MHLPLKVYLKEQKEVSYMLKIISSINRKWKSQDIFYMHCINNNIGWVVIAMANKYECKEFYIGNKWRHMGNWNPLGFERSALYA